MKLKILLLSSIFIISNLQAATIFRNSTKQPVSIRLNDQRGLHSRCLGIGGTSNLRVVVAPNAEDYLGERNQFDKNCPLNIDILDGKAGAFSIVDRLGKPIPNAIITKDIIYTVKSK